MREFKPLNTPSLYFLFTFDSDQVAGMILFVDFFILVPVQVPLNLSQMEQLCCMSSELGQCGTMVVSGCATPQFSWRNLEKERNDNQSWETSKPFTEMKLPPRKTEFTWSQSTTLLACSFEKKKINTRQHILGSVFCDTFFRYRNISGPHPFILWTQGLRMCYSNPGQKHMCLHACHLSSTQGTIN